MPYKIHNLYLLMPYKMFFFFFLYLTALTAYLFTLYFSIIVKRIAIHIILSDISLNGKMLTIQPLYISICKYYISYLI